MGIPFSEPSHGICLKLAGAVQSIWFNEIDKMVGYCCTFNSRWLGGSNRHPTVNLPGIGIQYFAAKGLGDVDGKLGFTSGCRTDNDHEQWSFIVASTV